MRRPQCRVVDPTTSVALADGPLTTAGSCMRWESPEQVVANMVIVVLAVAIFAVWAVRVDAPEIRVRTAATEVVPITDHSPAQVVGRTDGRGRAVRATGPPRDVSPSC